MFNASRDSPLQVASSSQAARAASSSTCSSGAYSDTYVGLAISRWPLVRFAYMQVGSHGRKKRWLVVLGVIREKLLEGGKP